MEQRLALPERVLMQIEKPARYIGNEVNMVRKNLSEVDVRIAMCFPDVYEIGMSYLGIQILYDMFNRREDVYCERVYSPWPDLDAIMRKEHIPLFRWRHRRQSRNLTGLQLRSSTRCVTPIYYRSLI